MILHKSDIKAVLSCSDKGHPLSLLKGEPPSDLLNPIRLYFMHNANTNVFVSGSIIYLIKVVIFFSPVYEKLHIVCKHLKIYFFYILEW